LEALECDPIDAIYSYSKDDLEKYFGLKGAGFYNWLHPAATTSQDWEKNASKLSTHCSHRFPFGRGVEFKDWAASFFGHFAKCSITFLVVDEVQRNLDFADRLVCFYSGLAPKSQVVNLVILGTPAPGLLKLDMGANISSARLVLPFLP